MSKRLSEILAKIAQLEKETPYNYCDRWCERCTSEKQSRCTLYQDEYERKITCIAHGKDPDDPQVMEEVMHWQMEERAKQIEQAMEEFCPECDCDIDDATRLEYDEKAEKERLALDNDPLLYSASAYLKSAHRFLKKSLADRKGAPADILRDFETIDWYHTMLSVKLRRALHGFLEEPDEDEFGLCDAVAQLQVCKKAIFESVPALRRISAYAPAYAREINSLIAVLQNVASRIGMLEARV